MVMVFSPGSMRAHSIAVRAARRQRAKLFLI
jgi:hypothetical protein